jgi:LacI family transcriptional regulator
MQKNTLLTISEKTGVSVSTVSRVLSGKGEKYRISQGTIDRVREAARQCDYVPDLVAKGLRTSRTDVVGLTVPNIDNPFFATLSSIVIAQLDARGYHTLLADSRESEEEERQALEMFQDRGVDGILAVPVASSPAFH